jgi:gas vesicle protein
MSKHKHVLAKAVAVGAVLSAGAGYLAGILTAPKSGKETRKDIGKSVNKAKIDGEKQLKKLHSELSDMIDEAETRTKKARTKANAELKEATAKANHAKGKARELLSAIHDGEADDPHLQAVVEEIKLAKRNLSKYLKK